MIYSCLFQDDIEKCTEALTVILPELLKGISEQFLPPDQQPDSTSCHADDLSCQEALDDDESSVESVPSDYQQYTLGSRSSSPLSAVDIFTEYNTNVLKAIFDQVEQPGSNEKKSPDNDQDVDTYTILVS